MSKHWFDTKFDTLKHMTGEMFLISKASLIFMNTDIRYIVIYISNHQIKLLCPGINLVPSLIF